MVVASASSGVGPRTFTACRTATTLLTPAASIPDTVVAEREAREYVDVWKVTVPCGRMKGQSEREVHGEGGRKRRWVRGGDGSSRGWADRWRGRASHAPEREELLVEGVRVRTDEFMPEATGEGVEPCKAKMPTELRGLETGRWGGLGGCAEGCSSDGERGISGWRGPLGKRREGDGWGGRRAQRRFRRTRLG